VLAPTCASSSLMLPTTLAGPAVTVWLPWRGVDAPRWEAKAAQGA
jgi:hypothetical protein